jgi:hypothetical protein
VGVGIDGRIPHATIPVVTALIGEGDIRRFQIAMDDPFLVCGFKCLRDLLRNGQCFIDWNATPRDARIQTLAVHEFEHEELLTARLIEQRQGLTDVFEESTSRRQPQDVVSPAHRKA